MKTEKKNLSKQGTIFGGSVKGVGSTALSSFMRNMDETVLNSNWHILQINTTFEPGVLKVWALTEVGNMFSVKLKVNRTVCINSKIVNTDSDFKRVEKHLPRNRKVHFLYEWESSEENFQAKFNNIKYTHLMNHNVEGIYETKVPPKFRTLMELGAIVKPRSGMIPRNEQALGRTYTIQELENRPPMDGSSYYLPDDLYDGIYLSHAHQGNRHIWGLFIEATKEV